MDLIINIELENLEENNCCICLNTHTQKNSEIKLTCCNQILHKNCLLDWVCANANVSISCPICRKNLKIKKEIKLHEFVEYVNEEMSKKSNKDKNSEKVREILSKMYKNDYFVGIVIDDQKYDIEIDTLYHNINIYLKIIFLALMLTIIVFVIISTIKR